LPGSNRRPYHESFEFYREHLTTLADRLAERNIRLGIMSASMDSNPGDYAYPFITTPDALLALLKMTVSSNLGMLVDAWSWAVAEVSFDEVKSLRSEQVTAVRLADLPPETPLERATPQDRLMPGATGAVKSTALLRALAEIEFRGPIMPFVHPSHLEGMKREEAVQKGAEAIDRCMTEAGLDRFGKLVSETAAE
ncbi:MAG: TIM barrel protein, partial [Planctomycetota bacterium]